MLNHTEFKEYFNRNFWRSFDQASSVFGEISAKKKSEIVQELYNDIQNRNYSPAAPKTYIYANKGGSIARSIPIFEIKDYCLYYFCIKRIEDKIAVNRTENTFGGWTIGGLMRKSEEEEMKEKTIVHQSYEEMMADIYGVSISQYSFNPAAWSKWYGDFNAKLYATSQEGSFKWSVEFDIANFYDCIRLDLLEIWIREIADKKSSEEVSLLFYFMNYWNKKANAYNKQTVGIPQDAFGDISRILANFYLREYDAYIANLCDQHSCKYFRYSDDQFIFAEKKETLEYLLFLASKKLNSFGLNINQKKIEYRTVEDLMDHRSFEIFDELKDGKDKDPEAVQKFLDKYFEVRDHSTGSDLKNRGLPLLNKAIHCNLKNISTERKHRTIGYLLEDNFLKQARSHQLVKLYEILEEEEEKKSMIKQLEQIAASTYHSVFHYEVLQFLQTIKKDTTAIKNRIKELEKE